MPFEGGDEDRRWPFFYYRADWLTLCAQVPTASEWCGGNRSAFRDNGGHASPVLEEAMAA